MKGVIAICLAEMIESKFGKEKLAQVFAAGNMPKQSFLPTQDVPDRAVLKLFGAACSTLKLSEEKAAEAFGEYW